MTSLKSDVLVSLKIKGFADPGVLAKQLRLSAPELSMMFEALEADGLIKPVLLGYKLRKGGLIAASDAWAAERSLVDRSEIASIAEAFHALDQDMRSVLSDWKMKKTPDGPARNTHRDAAYDGALLRQMDALCAQVEPLLARLGGRIPRCSNYAPRLSRAIARIKTGDSVYVAGTSIDSLSTIWLELRDDIEFFNTAATVPAL